MTSEGIFYAAASFSSFLYTRQKRTKKEQKWLRHRFMPPNIGSWIKNPTFGKAALLIEPPRRKDAKRLRIIKKLGDLASWRFKKIWRIFMSDFYCKRLRLFPVWE